MREIKFRAWDHVNGIMLFADIHELKDVGRDWTAWELPEDSPTNQGECFEIMQYTGLKDKNGVDIYEDDVVTSKVRVLPDNLKYWTTEVVKPLVCTQFESGVNENQGDLYFYSEIEVLGNIHQNPELLRKCNAQN